jgi:hypothetical protein
VQGDHRTYQGGNVDGVHVVVVLGGEHLDDLLGDQVWKMVEDFLR